jgi:competence protein ComFC
MIPWYNIPMQNFFSLLFPPKCLSCGIPIHESIVCPSCYEKAAHYYGEDSQLDVPNYLGLCTYSPELRKLIEALKFKKNLKVLPILQQIILKLSPAYPRIDFIVPVPLHPDRLTERGFNQSELLVKPLANKLKAKILTNLVYHKKNIAHLHSMSKIDRLKHIPEAFAVWDNHEVITDKTIIIFDDIITTGTTMKTIQALLSELKPKKIYCLGLARPLLD